MIAIIADKTAFDLRNVLSLWWRASKNSKICISENLESLQTDMITDTEVPRNCVLVYDGILLLHSVQSQSNMRASYASMARIMLSLALGSGKATATHVCLAKYVDNSIKDSEWKLRDTVDSVYVCNNRARANNQAERTETPHQWNIQDWICQRVRKRSLLEYLWLKTLLASYDNECIQYIP